MHGEVAKLAKMARQAERAEVAATAVAGAAGVGSPHALLLPDCVQRIIYRLSLDTLFVRRTQLFTFQYARACFEEYEHVCKMRLVCTQSAVLGFQSLPAVKLLRRRAHRYTQNLTRRRFGPRSSK